MDKPDVPGVGARLGRIPVGGVVARYKVSRVAVLEGHVEAVVGERIGVGGFGGIRSLEGDGDLVPLFEFAEDLAAAASARDRRAERCRVQDGDEAGGGEDRTEPPDGGRGSCEFDGFSSRVLFYE